MYHIDTFDYIKINYTRKILKQHYIGGKPVFKKEAIFKEFKGSVITESLELGEKLLSLWNNDTWEYTFVSAVPHKVSLNEYIHTLHNGYKFVETLRGIKRVSA